MVLRGFGVIAGGTSLRLALGAMLVVAAASSLSSAPARAADLPPGEPSGFGGQLSQAAAPAPLPDYVFADAMDRKVHLSDFKGRVLLINVWATWCPPCVKEMPALDRLQTRLGGAGFTVLAISLDRGNAYQVRPFVQKNGLDHLPIYYDPFGSALKTFAITALPTSILIDRDGNELARLTGDADWDQPKAEAFVKKAIGEVQKAEQ